MAKIKQVILIRRDLKMRRGKEIAQGSHASSAFLVSRLAQSDAKDPLSEVERYWVEHGMAKICLKVNSEDELLECHQKALEAGLVSHLIRDSGKTEFGGTPTLTACAIGPDSAEKIDEITRDLTLY